MTVQTLIWGVQIVRTSLSAWMHYPAGRLDHASFVEPELPHDFWIPSTQTPVILPSPPGWNLVARRIQCNSLPVENFLANDRIADRFSCVHAAFLLEKDIQTDS